MSYNLDLEGRKKLVQSVQLDDKKINICLTHKEFVKNINKLNLLFEDQLTDSQLVELVMYRQLKHIVQNSVQSAKEKLQFIENIQKEPNRFFDLDFNLLEEGSAVEIFEFSQTTNRQELIEKVCQFCLLDPKSARAIRPIQVMEELIMNAQVNAPQLRPGGLAAKAYIKVEYSDTLLAISVFDYYGTLDIKKFFKKVENVLALGLEKALNFGRGGAGIGSTIVFKNSDSLYIGVLPFKKTRVSITMPYKAADKKFENLQRSIHVIESQG